MKYMVKSSAIITICRLNIKQIRKAQEGEYIAADYMPTTEKSTDGMYEELLGYIKKVENPVSETGAGVLFCKRRDIYP